MSIFRCKVTLRGSRPPIWRRIDVPPDATLFDFHRILQIVMGWCDGHLHQFEHGGVVYSLPHPEMDRGDVDERSVRLGEVLRRPKQRLIYEYDFGDSWIHDVALEAIADGSVPHALVVGGKRACPPEDVGGVGGFARFLGVMRTPRHPEYADTKAWIGGPFDPEAFDMSAVNRALAAVQVGPTRPAPPKARGRAATRPVRPRHTELATQRGLALRPGTGRPLGRKQKSFNRLVATVETLRGRLDGDRRRLDEALVFHAAEVRPRVERVAATRKDLVRALVPYLGDRRLKRGDQGILRTMLAEQLDDILESDAALEDDLRALFDELHGADLGQVEHAHMEGARAALEDMFVEAGIAVDLSAFTPGMSAEEMAAKMAELTDNLRRQAEAAEPRTAPGRRPTQREGRVDEWARQQDELRKTTLSGLFRQLAKVLHPDLEADPQVRQHKSALMQELTVAHANGDMHTMLRLELDWLRHEEGDAVRMTDARLDAYIALLEEQAADLTAEIEALPYSPRYFPLVQDGPFGLGLRVDGAAEVRRLDDIMTGMTWSLARLRMKDAIEEVRQAIQTRRNVRRRG